MKNDTVSPFKIDVAEELLSDLRQRLENTRWSYQAPGTTWDAGTDYLYLKELVGYWQDGFRPKGRPASLGNFTVAYTVAVNSARQSVPSSTILTCR